MKRTRNVKLEFYVTQDEQEIIRQKMERYGCTNLSAYLRKMAIDGYVISLDLPELREVSSLLRRSSNNINQIAKRANETRRVYDEDLKEIQKKQDELIEGVGKILTALSTLR